MAKLKTHNDKYLGSYGVIARESIKSDRLILLILFFSIFSVIAQVAMIFSSWGKLPPQLPLFYSRPWGEAILSSPMGLWILPAISLSVLILNFFITIFIIKEDKFLKLTLVIFCFLVSLTTLWGALKIILLLV